MNVKQVILNTQLSMLNLGGDKMEKLKLYRQKMGLTQEELAKKSGISRVTISALENGRQETTTNTTIIALAGALGISAGDLF